MKKLSHLATLIIKHFCNNIFKTLLHISNVHYRFSTNSLWQLLPGSEITVRQKTLYCLEDNGYFLEWDINHLLCDWMWLYNNIVVILRKLLYKKMINVNIYISIYHNKTLLETIEGGGATLLGTRGGELIFNFIQFICSWSTLHKRGDIFLRLSRKSESPKGF